MERENFLKKPASGLKFAEPSGHPPRLHAGKDLKAFFLGFPGS